MKSRKWHDAYTARARKQGYPARSVFKLQEIQQRYGVLKKGGRILDLGCAPGSWLAFASRAVGQQGSVVGVDVSPVTMTLPENVRFIHHDVLRWDRAFLEALNGPFDAVLSDMAPSTSGNKFVDAQRSLGLCEAALEISIKVLRPGGAFVCKIFHGTDFKEFSDRAKQFFERLAHVRPMSTRKASKEIFVVGLNKKRATTASND
ncbi:MAG: RlmE family RNA methyltransferase [Deltaproteobacteria bacterium]|nr:RlmE family RNA methyltransferase [Deltaproteobacteria bacterium]